MSAVCVSENSSLRSQFSSQSLTELLSGLHCSNQVTSLANLSMFYEKKLQVKKEERERDEKRRRVRVTRTDEEREMKREREK